SLLSYQRFARCYRRFYKFQPEITRSIYDQFVSQLQTSIKDEIQEIIDEGNLEALLNSLDNLEKEAGGKTDLEWRPCGIPEEDLRSHLVPYLLQQREYFRKILKERVEENAKMAQAVLAGRERIEQMQQEIEKRKKAWQMQLPIVWPTLAAPQLSSPDKRPVTLQEDPGAAMSRHKDLL
ncbi:polyamine-modulated factor 1-like, partial [Discoglossus pictus]